MAAAGGPQAPGPRHQVGGFDEALSREAVEGLLRDVPGAPSGDTFVCVGDVIDTSNQEAFLRGHGTQVVEGRLVATVCGVVHRINQLVAVRPAAARYVAQVGDVVVGRVTEISGKRWRVDLAGRQQAALMLSAVNLPGGVQRRRTADDELHMRQFFAEGDLVSAEVQALQHDGSVALHTRSRRYGKLARGLLVQVPPALVKRQKQHMTTLAGLGVDLVLGVNGLVWVAPARIGDAAQDATGMGDGMGDPLGGGAADAAPPPPVTAGEAAAAVRVAAAIRALRALYFAVHPPRIAQVVALADAQGIATADMTRPTFLAMVVEQEIEHRGGDVS